MANMIKEQERNAVSLAMALDIAREKLSLKQQIALEAAEKGLSFKKASVEAGYATSQPFAEGTALRACFEMMCLLKQLRGGIELHVKRAKLMKLYDVASDPSNKDNYNPSAAVSAMKLLAAIDKDIGTTESVNAPSIIMVNTGIPHRQIEAESNVIEVETPASIAGVQKGSSNRYNYD